MNTRTYPRWIALFVVPVLMASTLVGCQRSGEDTGASSGSSAGTSGGGTTQSGGGKSSSRSERQGASGSESPGEKSPSR